MFKWFKINKKNNTIPFIGELCDHDYIYYNKAKIPCGFGNEEIDYRFICKKCEKEVNITYYKLERLIKDCNDIYKKNIALEKINSDDFEELTFCIKDIYDCYHRYNGKYLNLVFEESERLKIDLRKIEEVM